MEGNGRRGQQLSAPQLPGAHAEGRPGRVGVARLQPRGLALGAWGLGRAAPPRQAARGCEGATRQLLP